jgi:hypothetical protein
MRALVRRAAQRYGRARANVLSMSDTAPDLNRRPLPEPTSEIAPTPASAPAAEPSPAEKNLRRRVRLLCALTGCWGVATGYALFILISNRAEQTRTATAVIHFSAVLVVAVFVVALTEWFRDTIRGEASPPRRSLSAILSSVLLLAVFEVCVLAYEEVSQAAFETPYAVKELTAGVSGKEIRYAFLRTSDILKPPREFVRVLLAGYQGKETPSAARRVATLLGPEIDWTLFPNDAPRPPQHDAFATLIATHDTYLGVGVRRPDLPDSPSQSPAGTSLSVRGKDKSADVPLLSTPQESSDYNALLLKVDMLADLDRKQLEAGSQIFGTWAPGFQQASSPTVAPPRDQYTEFVPLLPPPCNLSDPTCEPPSYAGVKALSNVTLRNLSDEHLRDLLVIELNRLMLSPEFYNEDAFRAAKPPEGVKQLSSQAREDYVSYWDVTSQLNGLKALPESESCEDSFADLRDQIALLKGRLLPVPRVVELNRALLAAAFPEYIKPAAERFDDHGANLAVLGLLWMCAGGALGWILAAGIFDRSGSGEHPSRRGALRGLAAALGAAPVMVVLYVLIVRLWALVHDALKFRHELHYLWEPNSSPPEDIFSSTLVPAVLRVYGYWRHKWWAAGIAGVVTLLLAAFWQWNGQRRGMSVATRWLLFGGSVATLALVALVFDANLPFIYLLVALVWITPAVFIGMCAPHLRTGSRMPQRWGMIAVVAGLGLVLATIVRLKWDSLSFWLLVPGVVLIATGLLIRAGLRLEEYWPLGALALGLAVCGMSAAVQQATFLGVLSDVHELNAYGGYEVKLWPDVPARVVQTPGNSPASATLTSTAPQIASGCGTAVPNPIDKFIDGPFSPDDSAKDAPPSDTTRQTPPAQASLPRKSEEETGNDAYDDYFGPRAGDLARYREKQLNRTMIERMNEFQQDARGMTSTGDFSTDNVVLALEKGDQQRLHSVRDEVARRLELSIVGSLGFWLTVGLLAGWALRRNSAGAPETHGS